ncbi:MAG: carboxymuconolactone decarboxylase family protein [Candidatus Diapherotrites archaeon]
MTELFYDEYLKASEKYKQNAGAANEAYAAWKNTVMSAGTLDKKTKELAALCAACAIQCKYCIDSHAQKAKAYGATEKEITEIIQIATVVKAGATISYGIKGLEHY